MYKAKNLDNIYHDLSAPASFHLNFYFAYSPRKGTPAMRWKDDIPEEVKQARLQKLMDLQLEICNEERANMLGQTAEVLVDKFNREGTMLTGRTRCRKKTIFPGDASMIGTVQQVKVHSFTHQTLIGDLEQKTAPDNLLAIL
jgi:tRNA-2-methylthio-N6-dimethylallyladenosine synthase